MNAPESGGCPNSDTGGHYYKKQDGAWVCVLEPPVAAGALPDAEAEGDR